MTGKSRRKRGKQSTSRKARSQQHIAAVAQVQAAPQPAESATHPEVPSPPETVTRQPARPLVIQYPYVAAELRTIGILAGMILIVLIILYFTLA